MDLHPIINAMLVFYQKRSKRKPQGQEILDIGSIKPWLRITVVIDDIG
jgi:hypothetical protein